ncbi:MAG TPA: hypothetical protein VFR32_01065 [Gaiellaceae bacterium]|nr:hypothetical protein [Gaiellaceae bacterium]
MSGLLEQPVLILREKISYAQFRLTDEAGADVGLVRGSLTDYEHFDLEGLGGEKLATFRWGGEGGLGGVLVKGLQVFATDERHVGTVVVKRGDVTILDPADSELVRAEGGVGNRTPAQLYDASGAQVAAVGAVKAGLWRSLNGENDYRIDFVGEPAEDLRLLIIAAPVAWDRKITGGPRMPGD